MKKMHELLDYFGFEHISAAGRPMYGVIERLTFGWFWTDDPDMVDAHEEQDRIDRGRLCLNLKKFDRRINTCF